MSNIATTIEQSKHLLELGLSKETADMSYSEEYFGKDKDGNDEWCWRLNACKFVDVEGIIPAWSLTALLEVMPKNTNETYHLFSSMMADQLGSWVCDRSKYYIDTDGYNKNDYECFKSDNPITAAYKMVCWLLEQGLIEKGGQDEDN